MKRSRHLTFFGPLDLTAAPWDQTSSVYIAREPSTQTSPLYTAREQITADDVLDEESFYRAYTGGGATNSTGEPSEQAPTAPGITQAASDQAREGGVPPQRVVYESEQITKHAEAYALQGKKLKVRGGGYVV